ncbi:MAG: hypothetical protein R2851_03000 [Caldilineaceae bacterium]
MDDPWCDRDAPANGCSLAGQADVDLVHLNGYAHGALPWGRPVLMVGHSCVLSWWQAVKWGSRAVVLVHLPGAGDGRAACRRLCRAPTAPCCRLCSNTTGAMEQARVIYNGRAADRFHQERKAPFVFSAGAGTRYKNIQALACGSRPGEWPVYVAGPAAWPDGRPSASSSRASTNSVAWTGMTLRIGRTTPPSTLPARYELLGLTALEAVRPGVRWYWATFPPCAAVGRRRLYVPPTTPRPWPTRWGRLRRRTLCARKGAAARRRAAQFSLQHMGDRYYELYAWLTEAD